MTRPPLEKLGGASNPELGRVCRYALSLESALSAADAAKVEAMEAVRNKCAERLCRDCNTVGRPTEHDSGGWWHEEIGSAGLRRYKCIASNLWDLNLSQIAATPPASAGKEGE